MMVGANGAWDLPRSVEYGRRFSDYDVDRFEEPSEFDNVRNHAGRGLHHAEARHAGALQGRVKP